MAAKEMVLYYQPEREKEAGNASKAAKLKGVLIRMGHPDKEYYTGTDWADGWLSGWFRRI